MFKTWTAPTATKTAASLRSRAPRSRCCCRALVATLWAIGWLHACGEDRTYLPPLNPRLAHATPHEWASWSATAAGDDTREARLDVTDDVDP